MQHDCNVHPTTNKSAEATSTQGRPDYTGNTSLGPATFLLKSARPVGQYPALFSTRCIEPSLPSMKLATLSTNRRTLSFRKVAVRSALCGDKRTFSMPHSGLSFERGSVQKTSSAAPLDRDGARKDSSTGENTCKNQKWRKTPTTSWSCPKPRNSEYNKVFSTRFRSPIDHAYCVFALVLESIMF